ncbi:MAG: protoglobin domain-containing protein [Myxococcales bacterium]
MPRETRFEELKRCARFDERDAELLLAFWIAAAPSFPEVASEFRERIRENLAICSVTVDEFELRAVELALLSWLSRVCGGVYDEHYYEQTTRAGHLQSKSGVPQHQLLSMIADIRLVLLRIADGALEERAAPTREAVNRILDIELAIMLDTYRVAEVRACQAESLSAIASLVADLAHEIRNPLNGAQLHLVILERALRAQSGEQDALEAARVVGDELRRVASMLTKFLELARPQPFEGP